MTTPQKPKRLNLLGALGDFTILLLLIGGAGFAGYYVGINQRLAPVQFVFPGTPGAVPVSQILDPQLRPTVKIDPSVTTEGNSASGSASGQSAPATAAAQQAKPPVTNNKKTKYWLASSGVDGYIGYSIIVKVNGETVDNFFGSGKTIDVTKYVKTGQNSLEFECKNMGDDYNKHKGDGKAALTVQLVSGPSIKEDFSQSAVLLSCIRTAVETQDFNEKKSFTAKE